jgi:hypothetical protein
MKNNILLTAVTVLLLSAGCSRKNVQTTGNEELKQLSLQLERSERIYEEKTSVTIQPVSGEKKHDAVFQKSYIAVEKTTVPEEPELLQKKNVEPTQKPSEFKGDKPEGTRKHRKNAIWHIGEILLIVGLFAFGIGWSQLKNTDEGKDVWNAFWAVGIIMMIASVPFLVIGLLIKIFRKKK